MSQELDDVITDLRLELAAARSKFPPFNTAHEGYAVLWEECEELWAWVREKQGLRVTSLMRKEAIQIAAMALRFVIDICDSDRGNL